MACVWHTYTAHMWMLEDNFMELVLSFLWILGIKLRPSGLPCRHLYPLRHLTDPLPHLLRHGPWLS